MPKRAELDPLADVVPGLKNLEPGRKIYVLDTNVLLHDPTAIFRFQENAVVIPLYVLDEIDAKKSDPVIGFNARDVSQKLEQILTTGSYTPTKGVRIKNGQDGLLFFMSGQTPQDFPKELPFTYLDNFLVATLANLKKQIGERSLVLVTKDRNLRIKSTALGVQAEDYRHDRVSEESLIGTTDPLRTIVLNPKEIAELFSKKRPCDWCLAGIGRFRLRHNEGAILHDEEGNHLGLGVRKGDRLNFVNYDKVRVLGLGPRVLDKASFSHNFEQAISMVQAMDDDIRIQIMVGRAGTGKTHIAMAAALEAVFVRKRYESIKLIKPVITKSRLGEDLGFLPGTVRKKLVPRMRPFVEKLQKFVGKELLDSEEGYQKFLDSGVIEMMNLADVRGADLAGSIVLFDEAQNANPFQIRTLGTRLGEDSKLIVMGDPTQIDNVYLDKYSNALVNLYQQARRNPEPFIATVSLSQMVRSHTSKWFEERIVPSIKKQKE